MRIKKITLSEMGPFEALDLSFPKCGNDERAEVHIFTGPNGCGKSSLLYALAAIFRHHEEVEKRFWKSGSHPHLRVDLDRESSSKVKFIKHDSVYLGIPDESMIRHLRQDIEKYRREHKTILFRKPMDDGYSKLFTQVDGYFDEPTRWAAFSYAGRQATLSESRIDTIDELKSGPFAGAMSFQQGPEDLLKWIALMASKAAIEQGNGNSQRAKRYREPLEKLEHALRFLLDQPVRIKVQTSPFGVALSVGDRTVEVGVLSDGVKSFFGWLGDLVCRLDRVTWKEDRDIFSQNFLLFLDEIDIHMHPSWQRKILRVVQHLFPNAQIFCSTHSPFVVNSVEGATVHRFEIEGGLSNVSNRSQPVRAKAWNLPFAMFLTPRTQYDDLLLKPDESNYLFHTYFLFNARTGEIEVNPRAGTEEQSRAEYTMETLELNDADGVRAEWRRQISQQMKVSDEYPLEALPFRFIFA